MRNNKHVHGACFVCKEVGHFKNECPVHKQKQKNKDKSDGKPGSGGNGNKNRKNQT
ncbi:hypothetical protein HK096_000663, partial [Nowakowskiella sp. JEL0078]